ncbi:hypothetical protein [Streptomyces flaveolus]
MGTPDEIGKRIAAYAAVGVTTLSLTPGGGAADYRAGRLRLLEQIASLVG